MKRGRKPTVKQKKAIKWAGLEPEQWLISKNLPNELHLIHRETGTPKVIPS
jgi:hypothetical protein